MARELGGWDYNDLWAQNLQMSVPMPYNTPLPFNLEATSLPFAAPASSSASTGPPADILPLLKSVRGMTLMDSSTPPLGMRGHYIDTKPNHRRMTAVGSNQNKAITKRLASASHYQQILDEVAEWVKVFDEVNVATALHRLAKLQPPGTAGPQSPVLRSASFQLLVEASQRLVPRFEAQAVSNTLWAFATLGYHPSGDLLDRLGHHAAGIVRTFRPQATSNALWAYAKLAYVPCEPFLAAAALQLLTDLPRCVPQDISNATWAFATLRHHPGNTLMDAAAATAARTMPHFKPQEIANTLWAFATLGHDPGAILLDAAASQMVDNIAHFRPQAISNSLWSYSKLAYNPGHRVLDVAARRAASMLHQYTSQEIANTLWAFATLEHNPGSGMLDAAAAQIARRIEQFSPQDTTNSVWCFARLFHYPGAELLQAISLYCLRHWHRFKAQELANMIWSLALLRACSHDTWVALLEKLGTVPEATFDDADLHQLYQAYVLLDPPGLRLPSSSLAEKFPEGLARRAERVWRASVHPVARTSKLHDDVSAVLWSLGVAHKNNDVTADGLFCVDIALDGGKVIIEVDGPTHFSVNSRRPLGRTVARKLMVEARGHVVRSIPYYEWCALDSLEQQQAYVWRLLASAIPHSAQLEIPVQMPPGSV
ncbi:probable RAP domain-containing protein, chloroplastic [Coccomyxa sp. Obi]|nr:probable RAP domain-containing protein, chloroplastic [Coccomyxa sp. Obi]